MDASRPAPHREPSRWVVAIALGACVVFGGAIRVKLVLENTSPLYLWDDAVIHLEVQYLDGIVEAIEQAVVHLCEERRTGQDVFRVADEVAHFRHVVRGVPPTFGRPLHDLAALATYELNRPLGIAAAGLWAVPLTSAIAGTLTIPLAFLLARRLWGTSAGLRAAAILAASGGHVLYSIEGFSEALLTLVLFAALLVHARSRAALVANPHRPWRGALTLGLVLGTGMLVHFRFAVLAGVFGISELVTLGRSPSFRKRAWGRVIRIGAGIAAMMLLAELPYYLLMLAAKNRGIAVQPKTYLEQVLFVLAPEGLGYAGSLVRFHLQNLLTYPYALWYLSGIVVPMLAVAGLARAVAWSRRAERAAADADLARVADVTGTLIAVFVLPVVFYSLTIPLLRYGATSFALAPVLAAAGLGWIEERALRPDAALRVWILPVILAAALADTSVRTFPRIAEENGYRASVSSSGGRVRHVTTTPPLSWALAGMGSTDVVPKGESALEAAQALVARGTRYAVIDSLVDFMSIDGKGFPDEQHFFRTVEQACGPPEIVSNPFGASRVHDLELNYRPFFETLALPRPERRAFQIRVYDLARCVSQEPLLPPPPPAPRGSP